MKIKTLYNGMYPINGNYIKKAVAKNEDIVFQHEGISHTLPFQEFNNFKSKSHTFKGMYGTPDYKLYYYSPSQVKRTQPTLL